ncbi:MAG: cysteine desulfurase [Bacteroidales bacterium]|jgi:cysteine desulfurase/selenocysteine lyase|nr:cysteine desulfurase CsdA [Lentimicrobiaceae bacterium]MDG1136217.1 cysteine desulfurase [Bacteroidales bacterium]MDG1902320.1 cysteine desulfurase [Bacteroidales bacterium]MDG2081300.1 cysteine desulfurase [Bacteroidales bacterium]
MGFKINSIRNDFPVLSTKVNGKQLVYLDNGATTHKPMQVIDRISNYYMTENSNVHRASYNLSHIATDLFENSRKFIANFINAASYREIIFTKGTTESVNLVASGFSDIITEGDEIIITVMEHHSNFVPWQQLCKKNKATLRFLSVLKDGTIDLSELLAMINSKTKLISITHISNVLGTINPVKKISEIAHNNGVPVFVDGAQAIAHANVDVSEIDCDFYCFSGHKAYGPMGIGVLYGKEEWLNRLSPYQYGGEMISSVNFKSTTFNELPYKFEAGTPNVAGALGLERSLRYIQDIGLDNIFKYEDDLLQYATKKFENIKGVMIIGNAKSKIPVISLNIEGLHPYDIGILLDQMGIAIRTGNHCAQPLMEALELPGTLRVSMALYNTKEEIDLFADALMKAIDMLT